VRQPPAAGAVRWLGAEGDIGLEGKGDTPRAPIETTKNVRNSSDLRATVSSGAPRRLQNWLVDYRADGGLSRASN